MFAGKEDLKRFAAKRPRIEAARPACAASGALQESERLEPET
jgi:hypothetical protein